MQNVFGDTNQSASVVSGRTTEFDGECIATGFAFTADLMTDPPDGGVEEQQCFGKELEQVGEIIAAPDVSEFVQ